MHPGVTVIAAAAPGNTDALPVGRLVAGAPEAIRLYEGLQEEQAMAVFVLPVTPDAPGNDCKDMAGQMGDDHPWQDQKAGIVG